MNKRVNGRLIGVSLGPGDPGSRIHGEDESLHLADFKSLIRSEALLLPSFLRH